MELVAGEGANVVVVTADEAGQAGVDDVELHVGMGAAVGGAGLPRTFQVSPTTPSAVDSSASSRISRPSISGRRTMRSSVPWSLG